MCFFFGSKKMDAVYEVGRIYGLLFALLFGFVIAQIALGCIAIKVFPFENFDIPFVPPEIFYISLVLCWLLFQIISAVVFFRLGRAAYKSMRRLLHYLKTASLREKRVALCVYLLFSSLFIMLGLILLSLHIKSLAYIIEQKIDITIGKCILNHVFASTRRVFDQNPAPFQGTSEDLFGRITVFIRSTLGQLYTNNRNMSAPGLFFVREFFTPIRPVVEFLFEHLFLPLLKETGFFVGNIATFCEV